MDTARQAADMAVMRQNHALISVYSNDYRGVYPVGFDTAFRASARWAQVLRKAGTIERLREIDPTLPADEAEEWTRHNLTLAAVFPVASMTLEGAKNPVEHPPVAVCSDDVRAPDAKGLLFNHQVNYGVVTGFWCCRHDGLPAAPVVFCDGSSMIGRWTEFVPYPDRPVLEMIGQPVWSTWDGVHGFDRLRTRSSP